ncbi:hypothetical protein [Butyrivibrio proteoclasticus]|nr:hypothetical protein [Butyrivibrio proteoclasticus]
MKKKLAVLLSGIMASFVLSGCGNAPAKDSTLTLYNDLIQKVISGEEMFSDEGMGYTFDEAEDPGYALYDIDKDGADELFITARMGDEGHTYVVYDIKGGVVTREMALNGYLPESGYWTYFFDYFIEGYSYIRGQGFVRQWELDYPWVDGIDTTIINYEGQDPRTISDDELKTLLKGHVTEPAELNWNPIKKDTNILQTK